MDRIVASADDGIRALLPTPMLLRRFPLLVLILPIHLAASQGKNAPQTQSRSNIVLPESADVSTYARERNRRPWAATSDTTTIPFVISASGGISLGSYQAGVSWSLGRLTRYLADSVNARRRLALGKPELWAATGASAGNINAVLSALEWCAAEPVLPEKSLFWRVWVNVGWPELFPRNIDAASAEDFGVFDRAYFKNVLFRDIAARMDTTPVRAGCDDFAIGVTATRLDPSYFQVTDQLTAVTQRYAATFQLERDVDGRRLVFRQADSVLRQRSLGEVLALKADSSWLLSPDHLFKLIEASSSFPIAFSPRKLTYYPASTLPKDGTCPVDHGKCAPGVQAFFTDGGVFDNNPLQLAFDIYERRAPAMDLRLPDGRLVASVPRTPPRALYVGTDDYRGPLETRANRMIDGGPVGGVDAVKRLIVGAIPAARQYEMQTLARSIADDQRLPREYIRVTRRYFPVFGEHVSAFGAFLGRPLREWDFYAGMYDGIVFAARDVICMKRPGFDPDTLGGEEQCAKDYTWQLISGTPVAAGPLAPTILGDMWAEEFRDSTRRQPRGYRPPNTTATDSARLLGLRALTRAQVRQLKRDKRACNQIDWADKFLCARNLDSLLISIREEEGIWEQYRKWSTSSPCTEHDAPTLDNPCLADQSFVALIKDPAFEVKDRVGDVLRRLWEVENHLQHVARNTPKDQRTPKPGEAPTLAPAHDGLVEFAEMVLRSVDWPARQGLDADPSSIPPRAHGALKAWTSLLPYQLSVGGTGISRFIGGNGVSYSGFDVGWQPTFHVSDRLMLQFPVSTTRWANLYDRTDSIAASYVRYGAGAAVKLGGFKLMSVGAAVRPTLASIWNARDGFTWRAPRDWAPMVGYEVSVQGLAGKAKLTAYYTGCGLVRYSGSSGRGGVMLGITDIPGIVYWLIR